MGEVALYGAGLIDPLLQEGPQRECESERDREREKANARARD